MSIGRAVAALVIAVPVVWFLAVVGWAWPVLIFDLVANENISGCVWAGCPIDAPSFLYAFYPLPWALLAAYFLKRVAGANLAADR
jgi:hypothetical protein